MQTGIEIADKTRMDKGIPSGCFLFATIVRW